MEGAQGQLGARLANRLGGDDTDRCSQVDHLATAKIHAVALGANAVNQFTSHRRADFDLIHAGIFKLAGQVVVEHIFTLCQDFTGAGIHHARGDNASKQALFESLPGYIIDFAQENTFFGAAVIFIDDDVLGDVDEAASQVTGIRPPCAAPYRPDLCARRVWR